MTLTSPEEIAWAAGLFEGEGCFTAQRSKQTRAAGAVVEYYSPVARIQMTDEDTVRRFFDVVGVGRLAETASRYNSLGSKKLYEWRVTKASEYKVVLDLLEPWLGKRRLARGQEVWNEYLENQTRLGRR